MKSFAKFPSVATCLAFLLLPAVVVGQPEAFKSSPVPTNSAKGNQTREEPTSDSASDSDFAMLPEGEPVKGIKVPFYDTDGTTLQMTLSAGEATRLDDVHVELRELSVAAESDDGSRLFVEFPKSVFNVETRVLLGDQGVTIRREDFEIRGDAAEFDLRSRLGKVKGNVKMTIFQFPDTE